MKIGIEGFPFQKQPSGIGKYIQSLVCLLIEKYPDAEFFIYSNRPVFLPEKIVQRVRVVEDKSIFKHLNPNVWLKTVAGYIIAKDNLDFYFSGAGILPLLSNRIKKVMVVHDLNYKIVPHTMGRLLLLSQYVFLKNDVQKANFLIVNSKGTAEKVKQYLGKEADTILNPPTDSSRYKKMSESETHDVLIKHHINYPYFLTVGTLEPRKNLQMTIDVFIRFLERAENKDFKLVVVGSSGWRDKKIIEQCDNYKNNIVRLGYVDENDLPAFYNGAVAFLFPSIYEGFGMPAREALYCGCQVIASDIVELRESCKGNALFIHSNAPGDYLKALQLATKNTGNVSSVSFEKVESDTSSFLNFFVTT